MCIAVGVNMETHYWISILYTIQLTAWTDAYGFDSRVSAKTQTTQTMRYNHRVKKMVKIKSLMFRIWLCYYATERIDNALREMYKLDKIESDDNNQD